MRKKQTIIFTTFLLLLIAFASCKSNNSSLPKLPGDAVILAFGDSLTYGYGATAKESYPSVLERLTGRRVVRSGVPGEVSAKGLERLPEVLDEVQPELVVLLHGGNDFLRRLDENKTEANIRKMVQLAKARGSSVVLLGVPGLGILLRPRSFYKKIAEEEGIPIEDDLIADLLSDNNYKSDAIHFNAAGYQKLAESIAKLLKTSGALS